MWCGTRGTGRPGESASRRRAGGSLRVCCAATVLNAALAWLGLSMAVVHVCRTVLVSFRIVYVGTVVCAGFTHCTHMAPPYM